jgi:hypothetical protein
MTKTSLIIVAFIGLSIALAKFLDAWIGKSGKEKLKNKLEEFRLKIEDSAPLKIAQIPLGILENIYNTIFGEKIFSKKAYLRSSIISAFVLISLLSISGLYIGTAFSIETPPWKFWEDYSENVLKRDLETKKDTPGSKLSEQQIEEYAKIYSFLSSKAWKIGHAIFFVLATLLLNAFFDATSLSITRLMLREALTTTSIVLCFCILFINFIIACLLSTLAIIIVIVCYLPTSLVVVRVGLPLFVEHPAWAIIGTFAIIVGIWNLSGLWLKIIALTTVMPILLLCVSMLFYLFLYPLRSKMHALSSKLLLSAISYEKGIFAFCVIILGLIGSLIGVLSLLFKTST